MISSPYVSVTHGIGGFFRILGVIGKLAFCFAMMAAAYIGYG